MERNQGDATNSDGIVLAKLRPSSRLLGITGRDIEPLYNEPSASSGPGSQPFALDGEPQWFRVRLDDNETPWDQAHDQVAAQLGIAASDVIFAEPDRVHTLFQDPTADAAVGGLGVGPVCQPVNQDGQNRKAKGEGFAWHLGTNFTQLENARDRVTFAPPETRIAHLDTGYFPDHEAVPANINTAMQRNFVRFEDDSSAVDPDSAGLLGTGILDNTGHGTGTLSILAGSGVAEHGGAVLGGAPGAEIVPIRVANSVVLLRTSSLAQAIRHAADSGCAVATLSMGGLPTRAWAEAVDEAYLRGLLLCAAGGNRLGSSPPKTLVYPARYERVLAVTGVMADRRPYKDLAGKTTMAGSFGPKSAMKTAMAAFTPNIPWAVHGCPNITRLNGEGTSAATPQVAAAAALWIEKWKSSLPWNWRRVEAVRHALYNAAKYASPDKIDKHFGNGVLQAKRALDIAPNFDLPMADKSNNSWAFLRLATGLGVAEPTPTEEMFNLELAQMWMLDAELQDLVPDPEATSGLSSDHLKEFVEQVVAEDSGASEALRLHLKTRFSVLNNGSARRRSKRAKPTAIAPSAGPEIQDPPGRRLQVYAKDPSLVTSLDTAPISRTTLNIRWEELNAIENGFEGEYLRIEDTSENGAETWSGVDLNDRRLLANDGWQPSEGNPHFHQQMVYAVAMKTIAHFELALGRPIQWRHGKGSTHYDDGNYCGRLTIRPHALRTANAFYSPDQIALLFGRYPAPPGSVQIPGSEVYTCNSLDIVAHETTHAILDGLYGRFNEATNPDVLAFHEGFADIVALLQQFTNTELLLNQIRSSRGDLTGESMLGKLAIQLGNTTHGGGALRSAIGKEVDGEWVRASADRSALRTTHTPHARGAILVGAVFDAFLAIYKTRTRDLYRIATGGSGVLPEGEIHPDLAQRLAREAAKAARHVLTMCIRALDYLPPVDVTFFDYLRALITADFDTVAHDPYDYRVAFVEAFSDRGIFPGDHDEQTGEDLKALSADTLRWPSFTGKGLTRAVKEQYGAIVNELRAYDHECVYVSDRKQLFEITHHKRGALHAQLTAIFNNEEDTGPKGKSRGKAKLSPLRSSLGLGPGSFEVHTLRRSLHVSDDGRPLPHIFATLTQTRYDEQGRKVRSGSTLVVDLTTDDPARLLKYRILKRADNEDRIAAAAEFAAQNEEDPLRGLLLDPNKFGIEPFAALHQLTAR